MKKNILITTSALLLGLLVLAPAQGPTTSVHPMPVSLIRLIANPLALDGRRIRVLGYLDLNGLDKGVGVYVTEVDARNFIVDDSVGVDIDESTADRFRGKYVIMNATYHAPRGPMSDYLNGRLDKVSDIQVWRNAEPSR